MVRDRVGSRLKVNKQQQPLVATDRQSYEGAAGLDIPGPDSTLDAVDPYADKARTVTFFREGRD